MNCFGFASLKLGISDSIVEVSLKGTIRLKEAELPRLMGRFVPRWDGLCTGLPARLRSLSRRLFLRHPEPHRGYTTLVNLLT